MASISERVRAGGRKVYLVQIIRRSLGNYRDSQTFSNRADAQAWAKKREAKSIWRSLRAVTLAHLARAKKPWETQSTGT